MNNDIGHFISSLDLARHPMKPSKQKLKTDYFMALEYFVRQSWGNTDYIEARLAQYQKLLAGGSIQAWLFESEMSRAISALVNNIWPWKRKYSCWLLCDIALILLDEAEIKKAYASLREFPRPKETARLDTLFTALWNDGEIPAAVSFAKELINQFRANRRFGIQTEKRFIVTAGLSAGKSTLINALVGKPVTKTSQEVCTANLCYIYNKPFEDNAVHLRASPFDLDAGYDELVGGIRTEVSHVASFFRGSAEPQNRLCLIDTPGANSAVNRDHGELTREALLAERYDKVIFVLNANKIGAGDEFRHLRWVAENVPKDKVIFVLNKLDDFNKSEDSVTDSLEGVRSDLLRLGYENPVICPLSAYFALLVKMRRSGDRLSEDEQDACDYYARKFRREEYDLSDRCAGSDASGGEDEAALMSRKCGLSGLEKILFGGTDDEKGVH